MYPAYKALFSYYIGLVYAKQTNRKTNKKNQGDLLKHKVKTNVK